MTKPLHAGRAASCGIEAVALTRLGLSASPDAIEHAVGYLAALSPRGRADRSVEGAAIGKRFRIVDSGLSIKKYPMCYAAHRVIDGIVDLAKAQDLRAADVRAVRMTVGPAQAAMLRNHAPTNALEAKFSGEFGVAAAIVARSVSLEELRDDFVRRPDVQELISKVTVSTVDTQCPVEPVFALTDRVQIDLADGRTLDSGDIRFARGNAKLPLRAEDLRTKFMSCAGERASALYELLARLESLPSVRALRADA
jgi:2-methylcitrate dehydratase PrpD